MREPPPRRRPRRARPRETSVADVVRIRSRAEATDYAETSSYDDVVRFLDVLRRRSPRLHLEMFATSGEGRALPLAVVSDPSVSTPEAARRLGRPVAFVMAN